MRFTPTEHGGRIAHGETPYGDYHVHWDANGIVLDCRVKIRHPSDRLNSPCRHLGALVESVACKTCKGSVRVHVHSCQVHGEATIGRAVGDRACCRGCKDYSAT